MKTLNNIVLVELEPVEKGLGFNINVSSYEKGRVVLAPEGDTSLKEDDEVFFLGSAKRPIDSEFFGLNTSKKYAFLTRETISFVK